jgi:hypothetical protein
MIADVSIWRLEYPVTTTASWSSFVSEVPQALHQGDSRSVQGRSFTALVNPRIVDVAEEGRGRLGTRQPTWCESHDAGTQPAMARALAHSKQTVS